MSSARFSFPDGKRFAFTILDDTDDSTVEKVQPIYDFLTELGLRTTKTVWPLECPEGSMHFFAAETLEDSDYLNYVLELQRRGFEITWHCATMESSKRQRTTLALETFRQHFGDYPSLHCNHAHNCENIYWGLKRYRSRLLRPFLELARLRRRQKFSGEEPGSVYYWGDLCQQYFRYVRNLTFPAINTLAIDPELLYRLEGTPCVNAWFSTSDAPDAKAFNALVNNDAIDALVAEGGICILSTHLGKGYFQDGKLDAGFTQKMAYLAKQDGWFVPVSELLDFLDANGLGQTRSEYSLFRLELRHIIGRIKPRL